MAIEKLKKFLNKHKVKYSCIDHEPTYTSQETAHSVHMSGHALAKPVILWTDNEMVMVVLPASHRVDLEHLQTEIGSSFIRLAIEEEFKDTFENCEEGAFPPFGNLFNLKVYVDESLAKDEFIGFNAGTHTEIMRLKFEDFDKLVKPTHIHLS